MSASRLSEELENLPPHEPFDWIAFSARVNAEFGAATTFEERGQLLAARAAAADIEVRQLGLHGDQLEKFTDACELEYKRLIVQETLVDGVVSYEKMLHVTDREIAAGRMSEDYALRSIAVEEFPEARRTIEGSETDDGSPARDGRLSQLKRWLHID